LHAAKISSVVIDDDDGVRHYDVSPTMTFSRAADTIL
jgi:hypothetical protein